MSDDTTQAAKRLAEMFERPGVNLTLHGIDVSATIHSLVARAEKAEAERDRLREALWQVLTVMPVFPAAAKQIVGMEDRYDAAITTARAALKETGHE
jgi:hypothetical protein